MPNTHLLERTWRALNEKQHGKFSLFLLQGHADICTRMCIPTRTHVCRHKCTLTCMHILSLKNAQLHGSDGSFGQTQQCGWWGGRSLFWGSTGIPRKPKLHHTELLTPTIPSAPTAAAWSASTALLYFYSAGLAMYIFPPATPAALGSSVQHGSLGGTFFSSVINNLQLNPSYFAAGGVQRLAQGPSTKPPLGPWLSPAHPVAPARSTKRGGGWCC